MTADQLGTGLGAEQARLIEREVESALLRLDGVADCAVCFDGVDTSEAATRLCERCGVPAKFPGITFDEAGVCSLCTMYAANEDKVHAYFRPLEELAPLLRDAAEARGSDYDCLLLFSGGKDSTYVLYRLVELGLRVMTFTFDNGFISKTALQNVKDVTGELGIEHVTATRADQNKVFLQSLQQHKSVCNGCFRSLLDLSTELAHEKDIPTIVTGLSRGQIIDERLGWFYQQGIYDPVEIEEKLKVGRQIYHQAGSSIDANAVDSVEVVDFYRYSDVTKTGIRTLLQSRSKLWSQPTDTGFCSSNCMINDVGVYVHQAERGYHNYESPTRWEVRLGHLERAEADEELRAPVNITRVKRMLGKIGYVDPADRNRLGARLTAYYVPKGVDDAERLQDELGQVLPEFLLPAQWVPVERIPREGGVVVASALAPPRPTRFGPGSGVDAVDPAEPVAADPTRPLTPAQQAVFAAHPDAPGPRARALLLEADEPLEAAAVRKSLLQLVLHHDALRLRFAAEHGEWRQQTGGVGAIALSRLDVSAATPPEEAELVRTAVSRLRDRLDVANGPLLRVAVIDRGARPGGLLVVVHELAADTQGWRTLLTDLGQALTRTGRGEPVALRPVEAFLDQRFPAVAPVPDHVVEPGDRRRVSVECGPVVSAHGVTQALADVFAGHGVAVEVLDHTARKGDVVGNLSVVERAGLQDAPVTVRYDHFGDLAELVPEGAPFRVGAGVDFTEPPVEHRYPVEVAGVVRDGGLRLEFSCAPSAHALLDAGVARQVADRLAGGTP
jgi:hypothetical protein